MHQPNILGRSTEYRLAPAGLRQLMSRLIYALAIGRRPRLGLALAGLALALFGLNLTLPLIFNLPLLVTILGWLIFGLVTGWSGLLLNDLLHPERLASAQIMQACHRLARTTADPWLLLGRLTRLLRATLKTRSLSLWRYEAEDGVLLLVHTEDELPAADNALTELPLDLPAEQLAGIWPVAQLPESALSHGLQAGGIQAVAWLTLGNELVGLVGLGPARFQFPAAALEQVAAQLALLAKTALLTAELNDNRHKLMLAYRRTIDAQDDERRNLAAELHDDILGRLTTMALALRRSQHQLPHNPAEVQHWLAGLQTETQNLNSRLREITQGLHPSVLTDLGLISAMRAYMDSLAKTPPPDAGLKAITLTAQGFDQQRIASPKLERDLYYITRQALDNAIKHAQAEQIFIHLRWDDHTVSVTVRDTGLGMATPPEDLMGRNGHLGLLSMQERAIAWQGRLTFHTALHQGTTVRARLPISQPSAAPAHLQAHTQYLS